MIICSSRVGAYSRGGGGGLTACQVSIVEMSCYICVQQTVVQSATTVKWLDMLSSTVAIARLFIHQKLITRMDFLVGFLPNLADKTTHLLGRRVRCTCVLYILRPTGRGGKFEKRKDPALF